MDLRIGHSLFTYKKFRADIMVKKKKHFILWTSWVQFEVILSILPDWTKSTYQTYLDQKLGFIFYIRILSLLHNILRTKNFAQGTYHIMLIFYRIVYSPAYSKQTK